MMVTSVLVQDKLNYQWGGGNLGGYLVERWVRGCAAQIGCLFSLSGLSMAPFLFEIGLDIGHVFAKCLIFNKFFLWFTYRLSKGT